jgi:hypothetical protein
MLSTTFGHADVLIWLDEIFLFVVWFWLLMNIISDLFRDHEISGAAKAFWVIALVLAPFIGVLAYLIFRGGGMAERAARSMREAQDRFDSYVRSVSGPAETPADQIQKARSLLDAGTINQAEYEALKAKALR